MIDVILQIPKENINLVIFSVDTSRTNAEEIRQAFIGERNYNKLDFDFNGFIYKDKK